MKLKTLFTLLLLLTVASWAQPTLVVELSPFDSGGEMTQALHDRAVDVLHKRLDSRGEMGIVIKSEALSRLLVVLPKTADLAKSKKIIERSGRLEFRECSLNPTTQKLHWQTILDDSVLERAVATLDTPSSYGSWRVDFSLTEQGRKDFAVLTRRLVGKPLGIFLGGEEISAPIVNEPILGGNGVITGTYTQEEATELANHLNAGFLPVKAKVISSSPN